MKRFDLPSLITVLRRIRYAQTVCAGLRDAPNQQMDCKWFEEICVQAAQLFKPIGFEHSASKAFLLKMRFTHLGSTFHSAAIEADFRNLEESIELEILEHRFVQVDSSLARFLDPKDLFPDFVYRAFPSATRDVIEAGKCIAVGLDTAAVFHLMHVVEWGMRAFANNLGLLNVSSGRRLNKVTPIAFAQWEQILQQLPEKIDTKLERMPKGPKKQTAQQFYYPALQDITGFKEAWRNHVMHTRAYYTSQDALAVLSHVDRFMRSLAEHGVRESSRRSHE